MTELYEPIPLEDIFCTDLIKVERIGPCLRLVFALPDGTQYEGAEVMRSVVKLVVPAGDAEAIARAILAGPSEPKHPPKKPDLHVVN